VGSVKKVEIKGLLKVQEAISNMNEALLDS
jgi:hypothetical protein